ncbi:MAG TPA: glycosyltransferase family 4 protein [Candidatus Sulfotelmatobacter sp.]|nr:glycosyltransferase family 4 protein [Candidatus Sulfotelmatobacter sp.]
MCSNNVLSSIALVTSGLGTRHGGIGVVAELITSSLQGHSRVSVWEHHAFWPRFARIPAAIGRVFLGSLTVPDFVLYDHVDLAVMHAIVPRLKAVPYGVFLHGIEVWKPLVGRRREALLGANLLLVNSATTEAEARVFNPWLPKVSVTWLGVEPQNERASVESSPPLGLIVGRMADSERLKGHDAVMDAWPLIKAAIPEAKLIIVGTGNDKGRLEKRVQAEHLPGIEFYGRISDKSRNQLYRSSRLLFYPSKQEGFGLAGVEAASFGLPLLGLAGTVTEELFPTGTGAVLAKDLSREKIAEAAVPVLGSADCAAEFGRAAATRVNSVFLKEHFADRLRQVLASQVLLCGALPNVIHDLGKRDSSTFD